MLRVIGRFFAVGFGCLFAVTAAIVVLVTLGLERLTRAAHGKTVEDLGDVVAILVWKTDLLLDRLLTVPGLILVAGLSLVVVGEIARIRSMLYYVAGGGLILASAALLARGTGVANEASLLAGGWPVLATAGFAGGFVYWLLAGRNA